MPIIKEKQLQEKIKLADVTGLFLLHGTENYLKDHYIAQMEKLTVEPAFAAFNSHHFSGKECTVDEIYEAVEAIPMMSPTSYVLVKDMPLDTLSDVDVEKLEEMLRDIPPSCALVFLYYDLSFPNKRTKKWTKIYGLFSKYGNVVALDQKKGTDLRRIIIGGIQKRGCQIDTQTAEYLIACVGNDLHLLLNEVEKLCAYAAGRAISRADIDEVAVKTLEASAFDITKALLAGRLNRALSLLDLLLAGKADEIRFFGALVSSYVNLYRVRVAAEAGQSTQAIAAIFPGQNPYVLQYAARDAARLSMQQIRDCLTQLEHTDTLLKGSGIANRLVLEETLVRLAVICRGAKQNRKG